MINLGYRHTDVLAACKSQIHNGGCVIAGRKSNEVMGMMSQRRCRDGSGEVEDHSCEGTYTHHPPPYMNMMAMQESNFPSLVHQSYSYSSCQVSGGKPSLSASAADRVVGSGGGHRERSIPPPPFIDFLGVGGR